MEKVFQFFSFLDIYRDRRILWFGESKIRIYAKIRRIPDPNLKSEETEFRISDPNLKLEETESRIPNPNLKNWKPNLESRIRIRNLQLTESESRTESKIETESRISPNLMVFCLL